MDEEQPPVLESLSLGSSTDRILLYDPDARPGNAPFRNLSRVRADGSEVWRAELQGGGGFDCYVSLGWSESGHILANTWRGFQVEIECDSGTILTQVFTK